MGLQSGCSIRGKWYGHGQAFTATCNFTGKSSSDGGGPNSIVIRGTTYTLLYYNPGHSYPYAIGLPGHGSTVRCWVQASVFPYATYSVQYNANGGNGAPGAQTKTYGSNLGLSNTRPWRTGYTFKGWSTSPGGAVVYQPGSTYSANTGVTLYAVWQINTYGVYYNANGGYGAPEAQTKTYGTNLTLRSGKPWRTGYTFMGWSTRSGSGNSVDYSAGSIYTANAGITLYAVWRANVYYISYNRNGATSGNMGNQQATYNTNVRLNTNTYERTGYTFKGWGTSPTGGVVYTDGKTVSNLTSAYGATVTLYAIWQINTYTVTFDAETNGGTGNTTKKVDYGHTINPLPIAKKQYYVFSGWYTLPNGGTRVTEQTVFRGNVTLYAHYVIDASVYIRVGGKLKPGFPYVWKNGKWCKGYTYVRTGDKWKQGLS